MGTPSSKPAKGSPVKKTLPVFQMLFLLLIFNRHIPYAFSPMPGGEITANTMMMRDTNTLHLYNEVIKEMADVIRKGGYGSSVTPVSQFYFQQAYANVTQGKWKSITSGYGNMILGYFGKTPSQPDPEVVKIASEKLGKVFFTGDPLAGLEDGVPKAKKILEEII